MSPSSPEDDAEAARGSRSPALWSNDAARLSRSIGRARRIPVEGSEDDAFFLEVLPAIDISVPWRPSTDGMPAKTVLQCREGRLLLGDGGVAMLCLLAGVPLPPGGDAARERLRVSAAVARLPVPLDSLQFSLHSPPGRPASAPLSAVAPETVDRPVAKPWVHQRLHVRRDDVSIYCDAWACIDVWSPLLAHARSLEPTGDIDVDELPIRFAFQLGRARTTAAELSSLGIGDVVRMPLWLDSAGEGVVRIASRRVALRCDPDRGVRRFVVVTVDDAAASRSDSATSSAFLLHVLQRRSNHIVMNNHPFSESPLGMSADHAGAPPPAAPEQALPPPPENPVEELSILLTAEVGTLTLSVGALKRLAPGAVFDIDPHGYAEVVLCTGNGQQVAAGRLVDIDGYLGIQVTRVGTA